MANRVRYKKARTPYIYNFESLTTVPRTAPETDSGPFSSCEGCSYKSHGFVCGQGEDDCLRTRINQIHDRERRHAKCISTQ